MDTETIDYSLFGEVLVKPATGVTATPIEALKGKVVSATIHSFKLLSSVLYLVFGIWYLVFVPFSQA
jgi:hypothetical protein